MYASLPASLHIHPPLPPPHLHPPSTFLGHGRRMNSVAKIHSVNESSFGKISRLHPTPPPLPPPDAYEFATPLLGRDNLSDAQYY